MPVFPQADQNFIHGLSDFWSVFFRDSGRLRSTFSAQQIQYGQLYLDLLDAVLGVSLDHAPLYSRRYFRDFYVREDRLLFIEGASPADDRWVYAPEERTAAVPCLMNRVIAPTSVVESPRDYEVKDDAIHFRENPLDAVRYAPFPVRSVDVAFAAALSGDWGDARPGDSFQFHVANGSKAVATVRALQGGKVLLDVAPPEFAAASEAAVPAATARIVREPFDYRQTGTKMKRPSAVVPITVTPVAGTTDLTVASPDAGWVGKYISFYDPVSPRNSGFHCVNSVGVGAVTLDAPADFDASSPLIAYLVTLPAGAGSPAGFELNHANIREGTLRVQATRYHAVGAAYPAGGVVVEGVDYEVNYDTGRVYFRTAWDPAHDAQASYEWDLVISEETYTNEVVPFTFDVVCPMREMALWGCDVLVDRDVLYRNFGYLLGFRRRTSDAYRAFLKGVARLYLLGASATRLETALNVMFDLPVVREDGEVLLAYDDGVHASTADGYGAVTDGREGRDGVLAISGATFTSVTGGFFAADVGSTITLSSPTGSREVVITGVTSATTVTISPAPTANETGVVWRYTHALVTRRFTVTSSTFAFEQDDIGADIEIKTATNSRNNGTYRVIAVESPSSVRLEASWGFIDETGLEWRMTRTREQRVTTSRRTYRLPFSVPPSEAVADAGNLGKYTFSAYEVLTDAFVVESEDIDPTWWHRVAIPPELLDLDDEVGEATRRYVSSLLIEHKVGAVDAPYCGDPDLYVGLDDEGRPGIKRAGSAFWPGGSWLLVNTSPGVTARDVGQYIVVDTPGFAGHYEVLEVRNDNTTVRLDRFPPPEAHGVPAPVSLSVRLPDLLFRRTVPFILMDRFLRRHAISIRVHPSMARNVSLINEAAALVRETRPAHIYAFIESSTDLVDRLSLGEDFDVGLTATMTEGFGVPDNIISAPDDVLQVNDAFTYVDENFSVVYPGGSYTTTITPTAPVGFVLPYRWLIFFARFTNATHTASGYTRRLTEGVDYTFNRATGELTISQGNSGTLTFSVKTCFLRTRGVGDPLLGFETSLNVGGENPIGGSVSASPQIIDRPLSIRIT
jgi:hypothetical protein